jgi:hypothetical protein
MQPEMAAGVVVLAIREKVREDLEPIVSIYRNLGSDSAAGVVNRALGDLGFALAGVAERMARHELAGIAPMLRRMRLMAQGLGLLTLADVADDLDGCIARGDATATAAVWARLCRVAERALWAK